jgi:hypothetical protein
MNPRDRMAQMMTGVTSGGPMPPSDLPGVQFDEPENPYSQPGPMPRQAGPFHADYLANPLGMPGMQVEQGRAVSRQAPFSDDMMGQAQRTDDASQRHAIKQLFGKY